MAEADIHHRTEDFRELYSGVLEDLKYFMGTANDVMVFTSSGTGAMESAVSNLFSAGEKVLVASAGKFGERWVEITRAFGLDVQLLEAPYGDAVTAERVSEALKANPGIRGVFVQATESSTGVSHDVESMARAVKGTDALLIVDAITGLGTSHLDIDGWGLDIVIGGSQKAAMIPPGLTFLSVSPRAWERIEPRRPTYYYFDLLKHKKSGEKGESPWTPAISLLLGLAETLRYIREIGRENLIENAQLLAKATREAAQALDLELFAKGIPAAAVTSIRAPNGVSSNEVVKQFKTRFGSIIANGQGSMKGEIFRIAHLGYFDFPDLFGVIAELEIILNSLGRKVEFGQGVRRVQEVYVEASGSRGPQT
jgi:aspartate aminotransferase-like enzyme